MYVCTTCHRSFRDDANLKRHMRRRVPCTAEGPIRRWVCLCGGEYRDRQSLYRHRKACAKYAGALTLAGETEQKREKLAPKKKVRPGPVVVQNITNTIQHIQVNTLGHHQQVTVAPTGQMGGPTVVAGSTNIANAGSSPMITQSTAAPDPMRFPGWPAKWPPPAVVPSPFKPLGFEITQPEMEAAVGSLTPEERVSCARSETLGVSRLLVEILKRVHSNPRERNVYLNPARADQALVFIPSNWSAQPLEEATQAMFARIRALLEEADQGAERGVRSAVSGARRGCEGKLPQLARASRSQLTAHLENVRRATASGEDWLGTGGDPSDQPAFIGKEMAGHLEASMLIPAMEQASGIYSASDVSDQTAQSQASSALAECARYMLHGRPTNLTVVDTGEELYAHEHVAGWVPWSRTRAAEAILRKAARTLINCLRSAPDSPLMALRPWLCARLDEVLSSREGREAGSKVLWHYTRAASRYYGSLQRADDPHDRREAARRLLVEEQCDAVGPLAPAPPSGPPPLTTEELEAMLGFVL